MRYTYTNYDKNGKRIDVCTRFEEILMDPNTYTINVFDNVTREDHGTFSLEAFDEWYEARMRANVWLNEAEKKRLSELNNAEV